MGTNVIYLAGLAVPSYRRTRTAAARAGATATVATIPGTWAEGARQRAAQKQARPASASGAAANEQPLAPVDEGAARGAVNQAAAPGGQLPPVLRVTRLVDAWPAPGCGGRLRLSGRLIDVCTELDRLAAAEAQAALSHQAQAALLHEVQVALPREAQAALPRRA